MDFCCVAWKDLGVELAEQKIVALDKLIKRGIPRSTFSPIYRILEGITNHCPMCGASLNGSVQSAPKKPEKVRLPEPLKSTVPDTIPCPPCKGTGQTGQDCNCMTCLGSGVLDKSNPMRSRFDGNFAKEQADKLERVTSKIVEKSSEIEANPQPLREDAKPENWRNI